jgi:hypothetical protein
MDVRAVYPAPTYNQAADGRRIRAENVRDHPIVGFTELRD